MLIEDEELLRITVRKFLQSFNHEVVELTNGKKAIEHNDFGNFDLIITDIVMPEKEGMSTIRAIKETHPDLPIIVTTVGSGQPLFQDI